MSFLNTSILIATNLLLNTFILIVTFATNLLPKVSSSAFAAMDPIDNLDDFDSLEKRIRALSTILILSGLHHTSYSYPNVLSTFTQHFTTLLITGDARNHEAKKVIAVTGNAAVNGSFAVVQNPYYSSTLDKIQRECVERLQKSFQEITSSIDDVTLKEHISDIWGALVSYNNSQEDSLTLCRFVDFRSRRKLFTRIFLNEKTWKVDVAQKLCEWSPATNELSETHWFDAPDWFSSMSFPPDKRLPMREEGPPGSERNQFSSRTAHLWAGLLGRLILSLESCAKEALELERAKNAVKLRTALKSVSDSYSELFCYVYWDAGVLETLLTQTTLSSAFGLPIHTRVGSDQDDEDESGNLESGQPTSDGWRVLRHLKSVLASRAAVTELSLPSHRRILQSNFCNQFDITTLEEVCNAYFKRFPDRSSNRDQDKHTIAANLPQSFSGTIHAEAVLMGFLTYFSESSPAKILDPKYCWYCDRLRSLLAVDAVRFNVLGSHRIKY
ncbi:hypothetical protein BDR07DRAFT_1408784, partial [Suillus spraguei]